MTDFLEQLVAERRAYVQRARAERSFEDVLREGTRPLRGLGSFTMALRHRKMRGELAVIAEVKRRSPALGQLANVEFSVSQQAYLYQASGAAVISVLTEPNHWGGSLEDLREVRKVADRTPILCKDVIVDEYQIAEARAAGADAVLLIAEALPDAELARLRRFAESVGIATLVEAYEATAFGRAVASGSLVVGINARDLRRPQTIDVGRARLLHTFAREDQILVAESGIATPEDVRLLPSRVDAILVGTALMQSVDAATTLKRLVAARPRRRDTVVLREETRR